MRIKGRKIRNKTRERKSLKEKERTKERNDFHLQNLFNAEQCDQIGQNFATMATLKSPWANF